jgi:TonB family protein
LEGELVGRGLLTKPRLPARENGELLGSSVVQVVVDAAGRPVSVTLLPPGSGLPDADNEALDEARKARFEPLPGALSGPDPPPLKSLRWGRMVFNWATLPLPGTNNVTGK